MELFSRRLVSAQLPVKLDSLSLLFCILINATAYHWAILTLEVTFLKLVQKVTKDLNSF